MWYNFINFSDDAPIFASPNYLTEEKMASEINTYTKGSVGHLYLTSDGGMNLPTLYKMVRHLKAQNIHEIIFYFHRLFFLSYSKPYNYHIFFYSKLIIKLIFSTTNFFTQFGGMASLHSAITRSAKCSRPLVPSNIK